MEKIIHLYNMGNKNVDIERGRIYGSNSEFYKFHHINDVPWDVWGELRPTEDIERL